MVSNSKMNYFRERYKKASGFQEIFELIKEGVETVMKRSRSGLMLGMAELGTGRNGFVGAFYPAESNMIVMNKTPLRMIEATRPKLLKPYIFYVLMHEYLHSLNVLNENDTRFLTAEISKRLFGENHPVTKMGYDFDHILPHIVMPAMEWQPSDKNLRIEMVDEFEKVDYIG